MRHAIAVGLLLFAVPIASIAQDRHFDQVIEAAGEGRDRVRTAAFLAALPTAVWAITATWASSRSGAILTNIGTRRPVWLSSCSLRC